VTPHYHWYALGRAGHHLSRPDGQPGGKPPTGTRLRRPTMSHPVPATHVHHPALRNRKILGRSHGLQTYRPRPSTKPSPVTCQPLFKIHPISVINHACMHAVTLLGLFLPYLRVNKPQPCRGGVAQWLAQGCAMLTAGDRASALAPTP
jgi:hypothetical protein